MKKLLLVIPIIFGTLCTTPSFAEDICTPETCETTRDDKMQLCLGDILNEVCDTSNCSNYYNNYQLCTITNKHNLCPLNKGAKFIYDKTKEKKYTIPAAGTNCNKNGSAVAVCQYNKSNGTNVLTCTAKTCQNGYHLWFWDNTGTGRYSMGSCRTERQARNYCHNWCAKQEHQGQCEPILDGRRTTRNGSTTYNITDAFTGCVKKQQNDSGSNNSGGNGGSGGGSGGNNSSASYAITYKTNNCGNINTCKDGTAPTTYTTGTSATITCRLNKEKFTFDGWCTDANLQNCNTTQEIDKKATGNKTFYAKCTEQGGNNGNSDITVTITCTPGDQSCQTTDIFTQIDSFIDSKFSEKLSVWKNDDGKFNTARLASDSIAGVVLGTVGGVITSNIIKKNQIENGFEDLKCTIAGQTVASYGDEFTVGVK